MMKDSIDFGTTKVSSLFSKLLMPTLLGMVFSLLPTAYSLAAALAAMLWRR